MSTIVTGMCLSCEEKGEEEKAKRGWKGESCAGKKRFQYAWLRIGPGRPREFQRKNSRPLKLILAPIKKRHPWLDWVNRLMNEAELNALDVSLERGRPFGDEQWLNRITKKLGLELTVRP